MIARGRDLGTLRKERSSERDTKEARDEGDSELGRAVLRASLHKHVRQPIHPINLNQVEGTYSRSGFRSPSRTRPRRSTLVRTSDSSTRRARSGGRASDESLGGAGEAGVHSAVKVRT